MKVKKIFTSLVCAAMALSMSLPVSAAQDDGIQPYGLATQCPQCLGTVDIWEAKETIGYKYIPCEHMDWDGVLGAGEGKDTYIVYEVVRLEDCRDCSFRKATHTGKTSMVFRHCDYGLA